MLKERARIYYQEKDYNCAEAIIRAANDEYALGINEAGLKAFGGFGGGMQCGSICGAVCGGIGAISTKEIETCAHQTEDVYKRQLRKRAYTHASSPAPMDHGMHWKKY